MTLQLEQQKMNNEKLPFDLHSFQVAYDHNPQAFCITYVSKQQDQYDDLTFIYANEAYEKMSGFSLETLIGHNYTDIIGEPSEQWNNIYGDVAYKGGTKSMIVPGPEIDAYVSIQCYQIAEGFCGSNVLDVTQEIKATQKAEAKSQESLKKIQEERSMYQTLLNQSPAMITVIDAETYQIVYANAAACEVTKKMESGYVGTTCYRSITHGDTPCANCILTRDNAPTEEIREIPYGNRTYRMSYKIIEWNGRLALMEYSEDITDSKNREMEFQQKVNFISNLNDDKLISKGRYNLSKNLVLEIESLNKSAVHGEAGDAFDEILSKLLKLVVSANKKEELKQLLNRENLLSTFKKGEREFSIDFRRNVGADKIIWSTLKGSLYEEPGTHDIVAFMYSYDSTDQIQESQIVTRLSTLEYGVLGLIDVKSHYYKTVYMAGVMPEQYKQMQGNYDEMITQKCHLPSVQGDKEELLQRMLLENILEKLELRSIHEVDYSAKRNGDKEVRMRFHYSYLDETQETVIFFNSDITENYEKEQAQIHKIEKALQQAQEANLAKTVFFSRMSHDMRTPMNGILGMTMLSEHEDDIDILKANIKKIQESGQYLLSLINDTLDVQRIESGRMKLEPQVVSTLEVVENIRDMIQTAADAKGVTLRYSWDNVDLNWHLRLDPVRVKQIFVNLLSNAVKFTPAGGTVVLEFKLLAREGMISHCEFRIRDTGIGMSKEFLQNGIFQSFSQENNQVTANYAGSGLGLSIAKSLVEMMGGTIEVDSELGVGTTFTLHLDMEKVKTEEVEKMKETQSQKSNSISALLKDKYILLAEDHPLNAEITQKLLQKVGCQVAWAKDGRECIEMLENSERQQYALVLMDIRMPVMDGLEAAKAIRQLKRDDIREIPIIAMTANAYSDDVTKCLEVGMNAHLAKPIEPTQMYETIVKYIN